MTAPYYLTTPIYYVNDRPHIGHCYTTLLADVMARYQRLIRGEAMDGSAGGAGGGAGGSRDVFFLTGTDEHADKVVISAAEHGATPQQWADRNAAEFKKAFAWIGASNDDFIRTTEPRHKDKVTAYISRLMQSGDIYKGEYTGWYDEGQEEYVTDSTARDNDYKSAINRKPLVKRTEPCYFFRLSKYQAALFELIQKAERFRVLPDARRQEVLGRLRPTAEPLRDVPVSRPVTNDPATQWGIRIPGDEAHRVYVWIDALFNYLSVVDTPERRKFWPPSVNLIGKDILWFHAVIWPALLMALGEELPRTVFGHGWWISEGQKMSKSLGNFIDLEKLQAYAKWAPNKEGIPVGLDALRWFLCTQGPLSGVDADFSHAKFVEVYNADLANGLGNCASRVANMIEKYFGGEVPDHGSGRVTAGQDDSTWMTYTPAGHATFDFAALCAGALHGVEKALPEFRLDEALLQGVSLVGQVDLFINHTRPFSMAKEMDKAAAEGDAARARDLKAELGQILYLCAETVRVASLLVAPAMPEKIGQLWRTWGCTPPAGAKLVDLAIFGGAHKLQPGAKIAKGDILFMRADAKVAGPGGG